MALNPKHLALLALRTVLLAAVIFVSFPIAMGLSGQAPPELPSEGAGRGAARELPPEEATRAAVALLAVALIDAMVLAYPILRSRWHGLKLAAAVFLALFGAETVMAHSEAIYFNAALKIPADQLRGLLVAGAIRALLIAPLAVVIFGKIRRRAQPAQPSSRRVAGVERSEPPERRPTGGSATGASRPCPVTPATLRPRPERPNPRLVMPWDAWAWRLALLPVVYVCLYFLFGYYVAWQSAEVRQFYTGSTDIKPFFAHMLGVVRDTPGFIPFQLLRGLLWVGLSLPIIRMMQGRRWETALAVGLVCGLLLTAPLLIPNPYMPGPVRLTHLVETSTSTFLYGCLIGWVFTRGIQGRPHSLAP